MTSVGAPTRASDLARARDERGRVVAVEELGGGIVELTARLPWLAARARPGEFAQLRCGHGIDPLLRRPMSVARSDGETAAFVFERVGAGTRALAAMRPGDELDVLGPLGIGFTMPQAGGRVVCVAGGLGCAPFPLAASAALSGGASRVTVLNGAASAARLYPAERFGVDPRVEVREATDDGSRGHRGFVTELVEGELESGDVAALWACGPNPMLAALAEVLARADAHAHAIGGAPARAHARPRTRTRTPDICEVSLEAPMGCGFGTCLGCALPVRQPASGWALCCRQGPVMSVDAVDWPALRALPPANVA